MWLCWAVNNPRPGRLVCLSTLTYACTNMLRGKKSRSWYRIYRSRCCYTTNILLRVMVLRPGRCLKYDKFHNRKSTCFRMKAGALSWKWWLC